MPKLWRVAMHEFRFNVFKKSFLITLFALPLFLALVIMMGILAEASQKNNKSVGYIDNSGLLEQPVQPYLKDPEDAIRFIAYKNQQTAQAALETGEVQAVFILAPDYRETGKVELLYFQQPAENAVGQFYDFLQTNLLVDQPPEVVARVVGGNAILVHNIQSGGKFDPDIPIFGQLIPLLVSLAIISMLVLSSNYLMEAVFSEKENRTFEVISTSLSPRQLISGKVLSVVGISLTILICWTMISLLAVFIGGQVFDIAWMQDAQPDWVGVLIVVLVGIPSYTTGLALMFTLGVVIASRQESEQIGPFFFLAYLLPIYFLILIGDNPNSPLAIALSLAPFTCVMTLGIRTIFMDIPLWQVAASFAIQCLITLACLWVASKAYRIGMLRYGQHLRLKEILSRRAAPAASTGGSHG